MRVGWIGMGQIGAPMALRVLAAGHTLKGHTRRPQEHDAIQRAGGELTGDLRAAVDGAELVCVNLFSEAQLREVMFDGGALAAMRSGAILAIHSTVSPDAIRELAASRSDLSVLDAAFSGRAGDAQAGRIALIIGGDAAALATAEPVFRAYADYIAHVGSPGAGMTLKLINNMLFAAQVALARDALQAAAGNGLGVAAAAQVLARSSGGSFAMGLFQETGDPAAVVDAVRPFLDKDVAVARAAASSMNLGGLPAATREFAA